MMRAFRLSLLLGAVIGNINAQGVTPHGHSHLDVYGQILGRIGLAFSPQMLSAIVADTGHSSAGPFDPSTLSGVQWDFLSTFGSNCGGSCTNGANQTTWADKSSNANNLSYASGACGGLGNPPIYHTARTPNSVAGVTFGGGILGNDCMAFTNPVNLQTASTVFTVFALANSSTGTTRTVVSGTNGALTINMARTTLQGADKANTAILGAGTAAADTSWHCGITTYDGTTVSFYLDGAGDGTATPSTAITVNETIFGAQAPATQGFVGDIAENSGYDRVVNSTERGQFHTYCQGHYGTL